MPYSPKSTSGRLAQSGESALSRRNRCANVRFGSDSEVTVSPRHVRFPPEADTSPCPDDVGFVPEADDRLFSRLTRNVILAIATEGTEHGPADVRRGRRRRL